MILNVFFSDRLAGTLESTPDRGIVFKYSPSFIEGGTPLSQSLPLQHQEFTQRQCIPFFAGILPEGDVKRRVSDFLHISESSTFKLLQELGGDCAGMISILPEGENTPAQNVYSLNKKNYEKVSEKRLAEFMRNSATRPLLKAKPELRLSLAGAQEKLPLAYFQGEFFLPKNGAPSTHIVKPSGTGDLSSLAVNEYICTQLARIAALPVAPAEIRMIEDQLVFITERYDRHLEGDRISRMHQEDMCQALGIMSDFKYQNDGGPGLTDIYQLIKQKCSVPLLGTRSFIQYALFNLIIGNCDAHGKNYSFLYSGDLVKLAPIYDVVCTLLYPSLTQKMSMKFGKHYEIKKIKESDIAAWATEIGLRPSLILGLFADLREKILKGIGPLRDNGLPTGNEDMQSAYLQTLSSIEKSIAERSL